ncbi:MAG: molybdopterin-dependent oxidoreductase [Chloroflexota bacterium]
MDTTNRPRFWIGALVGGLLTAPLIVIFALVAQLVGTPFVPFDVFDWSSRVLPGPLIEFGISTIVKTINALKLGETSSTAKLAEQTMAIGGLIATGVIVGAILFEYMRRNGTPKNRYLPGLIAGLVLGIPVMFISQSINQLATTSPIVSAAWTLIAFAGWGVVLNWVYYRLTEPRVAPATAAAASTSTTSVTEPVNGFQAIDRRNFLIKVGGATAAITVVGAGLGALLAQGTVPEANTGPTDVLMPANAGDQPWSATHALPNADAAVMAVPGTRPELTPLANHYRIDINTLPPVIKETEWNLPFTGLVDNPITLKLADIRNNYTPIDQFVTLACISNPVGGDLIGTTRWTGVPLRDILKDVKLQSNATHLRITSADDFDEVVDLETVMNDGRVILAYEWDGLPLATKHGFPLRIYIPNHYGMKQPKWITNIEAIPQWEAGFWVRRGWDKDAFMQATSVIDTVATDSIITTGDQKFVPIGGIAHAGDRGISQVQIRVDDQDYVEAQLRTPMSDTTWVIWRYDWPFAAGSHTFTVRCVDGKGTQQIETVADVLPAGATGLVSTRASL